MSNLTLFQDLGDLVVHQESVVNKEELENMDHSVLVDLEETMDCPDVKANVVHAEHMDHQVNGVLGVIKVYLVHMDLKVRQDVKDHMALLVMHWDHVDLRDVVANEVYEDPSAPVEIKACQACEV